MSSKMQLIFGDWRLGRILMFFFITSSVSFGLGGNLINIILAGIIGATLSAGGFFFDYLGDYKKDRESGNLKNPIARGTLSPRAGLIFVVLCFAISITICIIINFWALIPLFCLIGVIGGLVYGILDTALLRSISLGALQGFYVLIGALFAYKFELSVILLSLFLFFAMTGARVLGDTRDLPYDQKTDTSTIPKKYGLKWGSWFLLFNEFLAYIIGIMIYLLGLLGIGYLICMIIIIAIGIPLNLLYFFHPTPKTARIANVLSLAILGSLFVIAMLIGRL
ncbi:MAG: UbiA family prenyltransferase [Promethearchaeota archaeon]|nr:MAG: UbiA family prenyltransferase [Candidatus Lokiarchaeota archaeon]